MQTTASIDNLVLGTVNASWKHAIDAETLADTIATAQIDGWLVHLATFFGEVRSGLILAFANAHHISVPVLMAAYVKVKALTGETNTALEADLVKLGKPA